MHPFIDFSVATWSYTISAYSLFFYLALTTFYVGGCFLLVKKTKVSKSEALGLLVIMSFSGIVGARLLNAFLNWDFYQENLTRLWSFKLQGFSIFGSVLAIPFGFFYCRLRGLNLWKIADAITPFLGVSIALMRVGCFLNGCCYGEKTDLPWGVVFPSFGRAHLHQISSNPVDIFSIPHPVHPTQIYELFAALFLSGVAFLIIKKGLKEGLAFLIFATGFSIFRFFNNFLRVPPDTFVAPALFYPLYYAIFFIFGFSVIVWRLGKFDSTKKRKMSNSVEI